MNLSVRKISTQIVTYHMIQLIVCISSSAGITMYLTCLHSAHVFPSLRQSYTLLGVLYFKIRYTHGYMYSYPFTWVGYNWGHGLANHQFFFTAKPRKRQLSEKKILEDLETDVVKELVQRIGDMVVSIGGT